MSTPTDVISAVINENGSFTLLRRVTSEEGNGAESPEPTEGNLMIAVDFDTILLEIFDPSECDAEDQLIYDDELDPNTVIEDTLQTSGTWGLVSGGGNFRTVVPPTACTKPNKVYRAQVTFTSTGGTVSYAKWDLTTSQVYGDADD